LNGFLFGLVSEQIWGDRERGRLGRNMWDFLALGEDDRAPDKD
jgi:hypothetical protein